jgi:hypothetical protein
VNGPAADLTNSTLREYGMSTSWSHQPVMDQVAIRRVRAEIRKYENRAAALRAQGDEDLAQDVEVDKALIEKHLAQSTRFGGQSRTFTGPDLQRYRMVRRSLERAMDLIADVHAPLATHLRHAVHRNRSFVYTPEPLVTWKVILPHHAA